MKYLLSLLAILVLAACNTPVNAPEGNSDTTGDNMEDTQMADNPSSSAQDDTMDDEMMDDDNMDNDMVGGDAAVDETPGEYGATLIGSNFMYDIDEIRVKKGDTVRLTLRIAEGRHDLVIDEYDVRTDVLSGDEEQTIEFVADQVGTFAYYCSVGSHRANGMEGTLIVEE